MGVAAIRTNQRLLDDKGREVRVLKVGITFCCIKTKVRERKWIRRVVLRNEIEATMQEAE
jgi:hypothetical protein